MLQALRQPRWIVAAMVVVLLAATFISLGLWQLDRHDQKRTENAVGEQRFSTEVVDLADVLESDDLERFEHRRVVATGTFDVEGEVLIRSQVELGQAGFHVITPLVIDGVSAVLVNRGWVPLVMDTPPVEALPTPGVQEIEGWVRLTQTRPALGREDPPGHLDVFNRVDIDRIGQQTPYDLAPVYLVAMGERGSDIPIVLNPPDFSDQGPHLGYAIQWFGFAAVGLVGFVFLLRRKGGQPGKARSSTTS
jgi:surfeit locus 1 family protein